MKRSLLALGAVLVLLILATSALVLSGPAQTKAAMALSLQFTCAQAVDYQAGKVCVHTQPGAALTITIKYCSGYSAVSSSLKGTKLANSAGNYTWNWTPQTTCRGSATASVTAKWQGQSLSRSDTFTVK